MALKNITSKGVSNETLTVKTIQRNTYFVCFSQMTRKPSDKIFKKKLTYLTRILLIKLKVCVDIIRPTSGGFHSWGPESTSP